jgi:hypothetical protein
VARKEPLVRVVSSAFVDRFILWVVIRILAGIVWRRLHALSKGWNGRLMTIRSVAVLPFKPLNADSRVPPPAAC